MKVDVSIIKPPVGHVMMMMMSVFLHRSASPHHGFTIMNRLSTENLVEPINKDLEFQLQDPFLLYRNGNCKLTNRDCVHLRLSSSRYCTVTLCIVFGVTLCCKRSHDHSTTTLHLFVFEHHLCSFIAVSLCVSVGIYSIWFYDKADCQRIAQLMLQ